MSVWYSLSTMYKTYIPKQDLHFQMLLPVVQKFGESINAISGLNSDTPNLDIIMIKYWNEYKNGCRKLYIPV